MPPRAVAVVGYKNSGKTRVVETLVSELVKRGRRVGTLKHTADDIKLDTPGKDTQRHRDAGSRATAIIQESTAAIFLDQHLSLQQVTEKLGPLDVLIIEGFKSHNTHARILVPRENSDLDQLRNGLEIAYVKMPESKFDMKTDLPLFNLNQIAELTDLVEAKAFPILPGLNCHSCGYDDCLSMGQALLAGEAEITQCVRYKSNFTFKVNDTNIPLNNFTRSAIQNVILGFIKTLKGVEEAEKVYLEFETK
jgi:molybdopterin-guanine dinucleotide biosynthesis protein B